MMAEYISREAFVESQRHLYCDNCARRKGMKNGKMKVVYDIGDAPCRACDIEDVLDAVENIPAADVRPVVLCRDCKYGQGAKMDFWGEYEGIECIGGVVHRKDWFCADGEKREE